MLRPGTFLYKVVEPMFREISEVFDDWFVKQTRVTFREFETTGDRIVISQFNLLEPSLEDSPICPPRAAQ